MSANNIVHHIARTTASTLSPQDRYRQNGSGEQFSYGSIMTPGKWDPVLWAIAAALLVATLTMKGWLPLFGVAVS